jgi:hypothetical protein
MLVPCKFNDVLIRIKKTLERDLEIEGERSRERERVEEGIISGKKTQKLHIYSTSA